MSASLADTSSTTPTPSPSVIQTTCPDGSPTWEAGKESFEAMFEGETFLGFFDVGTSFVAIYDFREVPQAGSYFALVFDRAHCYIDSFKYTEQEVYAKYGVLLTQK